MIRKMLANLYKHTNNNNNNNNNNYIPLQTTNNNNNASSHSQNESKYGGAMGCLTVTLIILCVCSLTTVWVSGGREKWSYQGEESSWMLETAAWTSNHQGDCRPFRMAGYLHYDRNHTLNNNWVPFNSRCPPASLLKPLVKDLQTSDNQQISLPWLVNRTILLIGDSIERFHARDFCDILSASTHPPYHPISDNGFSPSMSTNKTPSFSFFVSNDYPSLKPPPYFLDPNNHDAVPQDWPPHLVQSYRDHHLQWANRDNIRTSPWICEVPKYGFRIITLFGFGLEPYNSGAYYSDQDWSKLEHTLKPLLERLAKERAAVQVMTPDLIEVSSGLWDLRQWSEEDGRKAGRALDEETEMVYEPLSRERLDWWHLRALRLLRKVHHLFPSQAPIFWRVLHHTKRHSVAPYSRVQQLDAFAIHLIRSLKQAPNDPIASRLKLNDWGHRMLGFENHFRDAVHPQAVPGSVLWSDMMLWEVSTDRLRETVEGRR
ncbi:hypothetical protein VP01_2310g3 [Puccinia sorghi]|uniref:Uncharacterized protein n=1 Tax=Puccinia sorghi TaxID=27349 RepID=A0A0L6V7N7_9BASI|nr:hypothetical protein VP01_2310g3 [Puccinia sorghi]